MALLTSWSLAARNAAVDALAVLYNSGKLRLYASTVPTNADTAIGAQTLLAELTFGATAFGAAAAGVATANAIAQDASADATGTATFFRVFKSDGTSVVQDGTIGTSGANLNLSTVSIVATQPVSCSAYTLTLPQAGA